jgi:hypothetical protein
VMRWLPLVVVVLACQRSSTDHQPAAEQKPTAEKAQGSGGIDPAHVKFCARTYFKMMDCFKDEEFWEVFSTIYFASTNNPVDEEDRKHWIGVMKEDLLSLYNAKEFEKNCEASLQHNKAPSEKSIKVVDAAREQSCPVFGRAFGYMVFNEGAFHQPR